MDSVDGSAARDEDELIESNGNLYDGDIDNSTTIEKTMMEFCTDSLVFDPIHIMSVWKDPIFKDNRVSVAILQLSGIAENSNNLSICVESEFVLKSTVMWLSTMTDVPKLIQR